MRTTIPGYFRLCGAMLWMPLLASCSSDDDPVFAGDGGAGNGAVSDDADGGAPGPADDGGGGAPGPGVGPSCTPRLARCDPAADTCCEDTVCVQEDDDEPPRCRQTCNERVDCGSLCCLENAAAGRKICVDESLCPPIECSELGGPCASSPLERCCEGLVCVESDSPEMSGCRPQCTTNAGCDTGCCVPFSNIDLGFCMEEQHCRCAEEDEECGGTRRCCDGLACSTYDQSGSLACKPTCSDHGDCATNCCVPLPGTGSNVCLPSSWCGGG